MVRSEQCVGLADVDFARQFVLREILEKRVVRSARGVLLAKLGLGQAEVIKRSRPHRALRIAGDELTPGLRRVVFLALGIERFAAVVERLGYLRRFWELRDQLPERIGRLGVQIGLARLGQVVVAQAEVEIGVVQLLEFRILGDDFFEGVAGLVVLLVFHAQIADAGVELSLRGQRVVGIGFEKLFPLIDGQIVGPAGVQRTSAIEHPPGRLGRLSGRRSACGAGRRGGWGTGWSGGRRRRVIGPSDHRNRPHRPKTQTRSKPSA